MSFVYSIVLAMQILVLIICMLAINVSLKMSVSQGQKYMTTFLFAVLLQNVGNLFELTAVSADAALVAIRMQYLGSCFSLLFFAQFVFYYYKAKTPTRLLRVLSVIDTAILILMWTCNYHSFFYKNMEFVDDLQHPHFLLTHGIGYIFFVIICCIIPWFLSIVTVLYQAKHNPHVVVGKYWKLFIVATFIPMCYLAFVSFVKVKYDLSPMILGFLLSITVIFILGKNIYDLNELTIKTVLEELDEGIIIINPTGQIVQCNTSAERMFKISKMSVVPDEILNLVHRSQNTNVSSVKINKNDRRFDCHVRDIRDNRGAILCYFVLILDITDTENYIEQLKILKEKADAANISKSLFLSNMSHEIRTPMNSIIGITEIMLREKWSSKDKEYLMNIKNSGNALISIINDILDFSKIEAGNMEFVERNYEPASMLNDLSLMFLNRIGNKDVELLFDIDHNLPNVVYGDEVRVRQVIINIVNNAIKFTDEGYVSLKMRCRIEGSDIIFYCDVEDTGSGISEENLSKLFTAFKRIDLEDNYNKEGTGLGLSISKGLLEHMGGVISVESTYGKGSCFHFSYRQGYVSENKAIAINEHFFENKTIGVMFNKQCLYDSFSKLVNQFDITYVPYNPADSKGFVDYLILDVMNYLELEDRIRSIVSKGTKIYVLYNPMTDQIHPENVELLNKPLYTLSANHFANKKQKSKMISNQIDCVRYEAPAAKILLVDDNEMNRKVAKELLKPLKVQITEAINGMQAIEKLRTQEYSLVLMDHMMPVLDGVEATKKIRAYNNPYYLNLPIIALTANAIVGVKEEFIEAGMNDFVSKPINVDDLYQKIYDNLPKQLINEVQNDIEIIDEKSSVVNYDFGEEINVEVAIENCGSEDFFYELLADFYKLIELKSRKLDALLADEMLRDYTIEVHALKNSARLIGAIELSEEFHQLEQLGNENEVGIIKKISPDIIEHYRSFKDLLQPFAKNANKKKHELPVEELKKLFDKLYAEVDAFDYDHADETLKEICELQVPDNVQEDLEILEAYMADVDMDNILNTITNIQNVLG